MKFERVSVIVALGLSATLAMSCASRQRRPVAVQPAPATSSSPATGTQPAVTPAPTGEQQTPEQIAAAQADAAKTGSVVGTGTGTGTGTGVATVPVTAGTGETNLEIQTQLENGQVVTLQWDGKTFKGNDKWDVQPLQ